MFHISKSWIALHNNCKAWREMTSKIRTRHWNKSALFPICYAAFWFCAALVSAAFCLPQGAVTYTATHRYDTISHIHIRSENFANRDPRHTTCVEKAYVCDIITTCPMLEEWSATRKYYLTTEYFTEKLGQSCLPMSFHTLYCVIIGHEAYIHIL